MKRLTWSVFASLAVLAAIGAMVSVWYLHGQEFREREPFRELSELQRELDTADELMIWITHRGEHAEFSISDPVELSHLRDEFRITRPRHFSSRVNQLHTNFVISIQVRRDNSVKTGFYVVGGAGIIYKHTSANIDSQFVDTILEFATEHGATVTVERWRDEQPERPGKDDRELEEGEGAEGKEPFCVP